MNVCLFNPIVLYDTIKTLYLCRRVIVISHSDRIKSSQCYIYEILLII